MISVIIPVYKVKEEYLRKCIESVISQTFKDLEIILIDDGSPDNCGAICDEYAQIDNRIKVIHKENGGVSSARNAGLNVAIGEYIMFVDADDLLVNNGFKFEELSQINADLLIFNFRKNKTNLFNQVKKIKNYNLDRALFLKKYYYNSKHFFVKNYLWGKIYKRNIIEQYQVRFNTSFNFGEDTMFLAEYLKYCKRIQLLSDIIYEYRIDSSEQSLSNQKDRRCDYEFLAKFVISHNYIDSIECSNYHLYHVIKKYEATGEFNHDSLFVFDFNKRSRFYKKILKLAKSGEDKKITSLFNRRIKIKRFKNNCKKFIKSLVH